MIDPPLGAKCAGGSALLLFCHLTKVGNFCEFAAKGQVPGIRSIRAARPWGLATPFHVLHISNQPSNSAFQTNPF